jgi:DNA replication regulator DPB11
VIEQQIRSHGGEYHPDLSRQCTHLLCASSSGKKYEAALKWGIACVGIEWLFQSIERGMALEAKFFTLDILPEKRGEGAWDRNAALYGHSALLTTSLSTVPTENENGTRKRRLRRTASEVAQQGILDGIFNGITETNFQTFEQEPFQETGFVPPIPIIEESTNEGNSMNLDNSITALFDGMVFYTWGFTDKKVRPLSFSKSLSLERGSH